MVKLIREYLLNGNEFRHSIGHLGLGQVTWKMKIWGHQVGLAQKVGGRGHHPS